MEQATTESVSGGDLPDVAVVASLGLRSTELGQALQEALQSTSLASLLSPATNEDSDPAVAPEVVESIQNAFGQAFAETMLENTTMNDEDTAPPRVLMRGRLDHYNRVASNWRMVADHVQLVERQPLPKKRKRTDQVSLWDVASSHNQTTIQAQTVETTLPGSLTILAYNDV